MNAQLKPMVQNTHEWLEFRRSHRTASETPTVLGISPWYPKTHKELARLKRGIDTMPDNPAMAYGRAHEAEARRAVEEKTGLVFEPAVMVDGDYSASLDGVTLDGDTLVEIKAPGPKSETLKLARDGQIPEHYRMQVQAQLHVSRAQRAIFAVWTPDELFMIDELPAPGAWRKIKAAWDEFWPLMTAPEAELTDYAQRTDDEWRDAVSFYKAAHADSERSSAAEAEAKARLVKLADKHPSEGYGVRVMRTLRAGSVDYAKVPQLAGVDLEPFRKLGTEYWQVREVNPS